MRDLGCKGSPILPCSKCARAGTGGNIARSHYLPRAKTFTEEEERHISPFNRGGQTSVCLFYKANIRHVSSSFLFAMGQVQLEYMELTDTARHAVTHQHRFYQFSLLKWIQLGKRFGNKAEPISALSLVSPPSHLSTHPLPKG